MPIFTPLLLLKSCMLLLTLLKETSPPERDRKLPINDCSRLLPLKLKAPSISKILKLISKFLCKSLAESASPLKLPIKFLLYVLVNLKFVEPILKVFLLGMLFPEILTTPMEISK